MPSRNKKNKNRNNNGNATSGASSSKNGSNAEDKTNADSQPENVRNLNEAKEKLNELQQAIQTIDDPQPESFKSLSDAKDKLDELQQSVDAIKASISKANASAEEVAKTSETSTSGEPQTESQQGESQTMKKKRNRNRNRKKNSSNANESGASASESGSTYGTHESSPTISTPITLPTIDVITSEIKEEPSQVESVVIADDTPTDNVEAKIDDGEIAIQEPVKISGESEQTLDELTKNNTEQTAIVEESQPNEEQTLIEDSKAQESSMKSDDKKPVSTETTSPSETKPVEINPRLKENEKQNKRQRQGKNANNNNQKEKIEAQLPSEQTSKSENQSKEENILDEEIKEKKSPETKNKNNKNSKQSKNSPNAAKKVPEQKPAEIVEPIEISESSSIDVKNENKPDAEAAIVSSIVQNLTDVETTESVHNIEQAGEKIDEQIAQSESMKVEVKIAEKTIPETEKAKSESPPATAKESKKMKGKKSTPQNAKNNNQSTTSEKLVEAEVIQENKEQDSGIDQTPIEVKEENLEAINTESEISAPIAEIPSEVAIESVDEKIETKVEEKSIENDENVTKKSEVAIDTQSKAEPETKKSELLVSAVNQEGTLTPASSPVMTTPALEPSRKSLQHEDETAKIWKILEEASKSLEPVEIQMDDDPIILTNTPVPVDASTLPIVSTSKDEQKIKEETKDLVSLLETKEQNKPKQSTSAKPSKAKENNNQQQKQSSPTTTADNQSRKPVETKKKDIKPTSKNVKPNKQTQQQDNSSPEKSPDKSPQKSPAKTPEKSPEKSPSKSPSKSPEKALVKTPDKSPEKKSKKTPDRTPEKTPPIETGSEATASATTSVDMDVPLDMSFLPDQIDVPETSTEPKNVQGSGFVPSVEQTAEAKSLGPETIAREQKFEHPKGAKSKSKSPTNANEKKKTEKVTEKVSPSKDAAKSKETTPIEKKLPEKRCSPNAKQKEVNSKPIQGKLSPNNKKTNGKPVIPPKPEHLVSSQAKKAQQSGGKSVKTEKILVLTNADDDDSEDDYIEYKFMPRQVFIATICQSCKKPTASAERILCQLCQMVSYCCAEHITKDEPIHKDLCTALQEIAKKRGGHIYNNARILNNNDYRSLRVHTLNLCENFLKRPLQTYEREILLFPRLCSTPTCREWRQHLLTDCENCGQAFYCTAQPDHLIESHQRWCKSVALYRNLVVRQSISGRIEPSLPSRIQTKPYTLPNTIAEVFKDLYKNFSAVKDECVFATLTQLATAPLTAYFAAQKAEQNIGEKFTIHLIGAELQFEADVLDIWETFFLHLAHNLMELTVVFCGPELNAENIPLDIISRIRMCRACRQNCRIVKFDFQCAKFYHDYAKSSSYTKPDLICFFNPGFHHINSLNGFDTWSETIKLASTAECPVVVTSYTEYESPRDLERFHNESTNYGKQMTLIHGPSFNPYSSQRPERNFISDEIVPLIFKNYFCFVMK